jgi:hypothetical protein
MANYNCRAVAAKKAINIGEFMQGYGVPVVHF